MRTLDLYNINRKEITEFIESYRNIKNMLQLVHKLADYNNGYKYIKDLIVDRYRSMKIELYSKHEHQKTLKKLLIYENKFTKKNIMGDK